MAYTYKLDLFVVAVLCIHIQGTLQATTDIFLDQNVVKSGNIDCQKKQIVIQNTNIGNIIGQQDILQNRNQLLNETCELTNLVFSRCSFRNSCDLRMLKVEKSAYDEWFSSLPKNASNHRNWTASVDYECIRPGTRLFNLCSDTDRSFNGTGYVYYEPGHGRFTSCRCSVSGARFFSQYQVASDVIYHRTGLLINGKIQNDSPMAGRKGCSRKHRLNRKSTPVQLILNGSFYPKRIWLYLKGRTVNVSCSRTLYGQNSSPPTIVTVPSSKDPLVSTPDYECLSSHTSAGSHMLKWFAAGLGTGLGVAVLVCVCLSAVIGLFLRRSRLLTVIKDEPKKRKETNCKKRKRRRGVEEVNTSIQMNNHTYANSPEDTGSSTGLAIADETREKTLGEVNRKERQVPVRTPDGFDLAEINRENNGKVLIEGSCLQGAELGRDLGNRHTHQTEENIYDQSNIRGIRILHSDENYSHVEIYTPV